MMTPAQAILWQIYRPYRWGLAAGGAYLLLAALAVHFLPALVRLTPLGEIDMPTVAVHLTMVSWLIALQLIAMFTMASADFKDNGFSPRMFVLPVRSWTLAAWPMLGGCVALTCYWWCVALLILRPAGFATPLWWPAAALAACLTTFQALSWTPFAQNWMRILLAGVIFTSAAVSISVLAMRDLLLPVFAAPEVIIAGVIVTPLPVAFFFAVKGVAMSRRGDSYDWQLWHRIVAWVASWRGPAVRPFASPAAAQFWFECRGHMGMLPTFVGIMLLCLSPFVLFAHRDGLALSWKLLAAALGMPVFFAGMMGGSLGKQDVWSKYEMTPFIGCRPMTTAALVRAKLWMAAASSAAAWVIVLAYLPLFLVRPGFLAAIVEAAQSFGIWKTVAGSVAVLAALIVGTWLQLIVNLWIGLTGRAWFVNGVPAVFGALMLIGGLVGFWIYLHPAWYPAVWAAVPWVLMVLVLIKLVVAAIVATALARSRLVKAKSIWAMIGLWCVVVAGLCVAVYCVVPSEHLALSQAAAGIALTIPFSRLAGAPLALAWNRHR